MYSGSTAFHAHLRATLLELEKNGLARRERCLTTPQSSRIGVRSGGGERRMLNLCANDYLGLAHHPEVERAARDAIEHHGFGMASVRFICGTHVLHRELEQAVARYLGKDDAILLAACFDANGGIFEALLGSEDAVVSDALNHASIIDGVRLSKARRHRYESGDMDALEDRLRQARAEGARFILVATDGVFSMDGHVAKLSEICALATKYGAMVMVDDCHATGHLGEGGRGTPSLTGVDGAVDIVTGTFGKTLGGAMGGFVAAAQPVIDWLRQRARPYLFSNSLAPAMMAGAMKAIDIAERADTLRERLMRHASRFRSGLSRAGFELLPGTTPIVPVMLRDARLAQGMAAALDARNVYATAFCYPVVPQGQARIRTQMSASLSDADVEFAIAAFSEAGKAAGVL